MERILGTACFIIVIGFLIWPNNHFFPIVPEDKIKQENIGLLIKDVTAEKMLQIQLDSMDDDIPHYYDDNLDYDLNEKEKDTSTILNTISVPINHVADISKKYLRIKN
jgi:hypothetical protein